MTDFSIIILILSSGIISYFNGFVKELFSFLDWLLSFVIALFFLGGLASLLTILFANFPDLRLAMALIVLFFTSFIILEWLNYLILNSIGVTKLSMPDRILAVLFGIGRGSVIVTFLIMLAGLTQLPSKTWWQESMLIDNFKPVVIELRSHLPLDIAAQFNFEPPSKIQPPY